MYSIHVYIPDLDGNDLNIISRMNTGNIIHLNNYHFFSDYQKIETSLC